MILPDGSDIVNLNLTTKRVRPRLPHTGWAVKGSGCEPFRYAASGTYFLPHRRRQAHRAAPAGSKARVVGSGTEPGEIALGSVP